VKQVTDALQSEYGLPDKDGGLIQNVEPNSPAAKAGLQPGDIVRKVNGKIMKSDKDVVREIGGRKVGDSIKIEIQRNNGAPKTLTLKVGDRPE
jgi:serine protease Do